MSKWCIHTVVELSYDEYVEAKTEDEALKLSKDNCNWKNKDYNKMNFENYKVYTWIEEE